ncbi:MAG: hypothetical protein FWD24_09245 [Treponema sp.]|nr:hypothetical protein [Treponema sp.]
MEKNDKINKYISLFVFLTLIFSILISCTRTEPKISFGFIKLVQYQGDSGPLEYFSFFILPEDDDGIENLEELFLFHDREQLRWHIKKDDWVRYTIDGKDWIGSRSIAVQNGSLPQGVFRAVLFNKSGENTQRNFTYDGYIRYPFPDVRISDGSYTVNSQWPVNRFVCYDGSGNYVQTVKLDSLTGSISQLRLSPTVITLALWAEDENNFSSAFTDVVPIN